MRKNIEVVFNNLEDFREHLNTIDTKFVDIAPDFLEFGMNQNELCLNYSNIYGEHSIPVRETSIPTMLARARVNGPCFKELTDEEFMLIMNNLKRIVAKHHESVKVMIVDDCVNSIHTSVYSHIPMSNIVDSVEEMMYGYFKGEILCSINSSYSLTTMKFNTNRKSYRFNDKDLNLQIIVRNSENGESSFNIGLNLGGFIPVTSNLSVVHKYETNMNDVEECLSLLDSTIEESIKELQKLDSLIIDNPETVVNKIGEIEKIPAKYINRTIKELNNYPCAITAGNIYYELASAFDRYKVSSANAKDDYSKSLIKLIRKDWKELEK